ncbi:hypothetical protein HR060_04960 [Catenovulum sp. SM1970]|uniref:hypothetical protein n=1 Tax=Marinifaba aquimaris TaxID=2741323 RepID=UPI001574D70B|nr:hypothetical protein [Marinifaba aquimaris]NTS76212.1 hypothetical protein [Marinifaba aquimaris]
MSLGYGNGKSTIRIEDLLQVDCFDQEQRYVQGVNSNTCKFSHDSCFNQLTSQRNAIII